MPLFRIKRLLTPQPPAPNSLVDGELIYNEALDILYYGKGTTGNQGAAGEIIPIAGTGFINEGSTNALTLDNQPPSFYLDRNNHTGSIAISDVDGLDSSLANLLTIDGQQNQRLNTIDSTLTTIDNSIDNLLAADTILNNQLNIVSQSIPTKTSDLTNDSNFIIDSDIRLTNARPPLTHNQPISTITDLQTVLDSKVNSSSLSIVATSGSYLDLINKPVIPINTSQLINDSGYIVTTDIRLTNSRNPNPHIHNASDITSGTFDLARLPTIPNTQTSGFGTSSTRNVPASGNALAAEVVVGNDTRLTDARTPLTHTHNSTEVTGLSIVATTGSYTDLINKPSIPNSTSQLTNDSGFVLTTDTRLSDSRTPTAHNQDASTITTGVFVPVRLPLASTSAKGAIQLEPTGDSTKFLAGNGTWLTPPAGGGTSGWGLTGNSGLNASTNFIGTIDAVPIVFRYENLEVLRLYRNSTDSYIQVSGNLNLEATGTNSVNILASGSGQTNIATSGTGDINIGTPTKVTTNKGVFKAVNNQRVVASRITTDQAMSLTAGATVAVIFNSTLTTQGNDNITLNTTTGEFTIARIGTYTINSFLTVNCASGATVFSYLIGTAGGVNIQPCSALRYTAAQNGFISFSRTFKTTAANQTIQIGLRADASRTATLRFAAPLTPCSVEIIEIS